MKLTPSKAKSWADILVNIGAITFVAAVPTTLVGSIIFGDRGVAWPTVLMTYPALMTIGAAIGFTGMARLFNVTRTGKLFSEGVFPAFFSVGHTLIFVSLFCFFLFMESKAIEGLLKLP